MVRPEEATEEDMEERKITVHAKAATARATMGAHAVEVIDHAVSHEDAVVVRGSEADARAVVEEMRGEVNVSRYAVDIQRGGETVLIRAAEEDGLVSPVQADNMDDALLLLAEDLAAEQERDDAP
jgi:predicted NAD/FAD-binding protein